MLAPERFFNAVIADVTYTLLWMWESEIGVDCEPLLSIMEIGIGAEEQGRLLKSQKNWEEVF